MKTEPNLFYQFEPVQLTDFCLLRGWLAEPHVRQWWGDPEAELDLIRQDLANPAIAMHLVAHGGEAFAFIQDYDIADWPDPQMAHLPRGTRAIDTFIGVPDMIGKGHGSAYLGARARDLRTASAPCVVIDPAPNNVRAVKAYERAGFIADREIESSEGRALLMVFAR